MCPTALAEIGPAGHSRFTNSALGLKVAGIA
jgi:hypothetical protein